MTAEAPRPATGHMAGNVHVMPMRVYYEDTDAGGIVYHANYLRFAERARTEMMRLFSAGDAELTMATYGLAFVARHCTVDYIAPARLDDALEVHSRMLDVRAASLVAEQLVRRMDETIARIEVLLAAIGPEGRAARLPAPIRRGLTAYAERSG
ncbi:MAG: YbgC/FadM family acyl-CoA thioesterase [Alphaproteobacteria bacterium]